MDNTKGKEIKPIGSFILDQKDIPAAMTEMGGYFHYSQVCVLITRALKS